MQRSNYNRSIHFLALLFLRTDFYLVVHLGEIEKSDRFRRGEGKLSSFLRALVGRRVDWDEKVLARSRNWIVEEEIGKVARAEVGIEAEIEMIGVFFEE